MAVNEALGYRSRCRSLQVLEDIANASAKTVSVYRSTRRYAERGERIGCGGRERLGEETGGRVAREKVCTDYFAVSVCKERTDYFVLYLYMRARFDTKLIFYLLY